MPIKGLKWRLWIEGWVTVGLLFPLETPRRFFKPWYREGRAPRTPLLKRHRSSSWILSWSQLLDWHGFTTVFLSTAFLEFMIVRLDFLITLFNLCLAHSSLHDFCHWVAAHAGNFRGCPCSNGSSRRRCCWSCCIITDCAHCVNCSVLPFFACLKVCLVHFDPSSFFLLSVLSCAVVLYLWYLCCFVFLSSCCLSFLWCFFLLSVCVCQHLLVGFVLSHTFEHYREPETHEDEA